MNMREQFLAESKGVKDSVKWLEKRIKAKQKEVEESDWYYYSEGQDREKAIISELISVKISLEKYARKLKHMSNEL